MKKINSLRKMKICWGCRIWTILLPIENESEIENNDKKKN